MSNRKFVFNNPYNGSSKLQAAKMEVLTNIFTFLPTYMDLISVGQVCKEWRRASEQGELWSSPSAFMATSLQDTITPRSGSGAQRTTSVPRIFKNQRSKVRELLDQDLVSSSSLASSSGDTPILPISVGSASSHSTQKAQFLQRITLKGKYKIAEKNRIKGLIELRKMRKNLRRNYMKQVVYVGLPFSLGGLISFVFLWLFSQNSHVMPGTPLFVLFLPLWISLLSSLGILLFFAVLDHYGDSILKDANASNTPTICLMVDIACIFLFTIVMFVERYMPDISSATDTILLLFTIGIVGIYLLQIIYIYTKRTMEQKSREQNRSSFLTTPSPRGGFNLSSQQQTHIDMFENDDSSLSYTNIPSTSTSTFTKVFASFFGYFCLLQVFLCAISLVTIYEAAVNTTFCIICMVLFSCATAVLVLFMLRLVVRREGYDQLMSLHANKQRWTVVVCLIAALGCVLGMLLFAVLLAQNMYLQSQKTV